MQFSQIHHGSLVVSDLTRAAKFYADVLGLQEIDIPTTFPSAGIHVRWFQIGQQQLHLLQDSTSAFGRGTTYNGKLIHPRPPTQRTER